MGKKVARLHSFASVVSREFSIYIDAHSLTLGLLLLLLLMVLMELYRFRARFRFHRSIVSSSKQASKQASSR